MSAEFHTLRSVANRGPDFIRPLGCGERFFHLYAQIYPVHFCLCVEIAGVVDSGALRLALSQVRARHPLLKARIVDDGEFGPAFHQSDRPVALETISVGRDADWRPTVARELEKPMDIGAGVSLRATALCGPEATVIVLTFCHAIADGLSGVSILRDMMRALAGEQLTAFRSSPPIEEKIQMPSLRATPAWDAGRTMPILPTIRSAAPTDPSHLRTNIVTVELSREETARLLERCRANHTTVQGIICAAAARHLPASDRDTVRMVCPVDLRKTAGIKDGICGVFIGAGSVEVPVGGTTSIWHDARQIVRNLTRSRSPEAVIHFISRMSAEFPPTAQSEKLRAFFSAGPQSSLDQMFA
jgi:hypothetical protein